MCSCEVFVSNKYIFLIAGWIGLETKTDFYQGLICIKQDYISVWCVEPIAWKDQF